MKHLNQEIQKKKFFNQILILSPEILVNMIKNCLYLNCAQHKKAAFTITNFKIEINSSP